MEYNKISEHKIIFVSYIDDGGQEVKGYFKLLEQTENYIKILSGKNILTLPYHKINKIKETR